MDIPVSPEKHSTNATLLLGGRTLNMSITLVMELHHETLYEPAVSEMRWKSTTLDSRYLQWSLSSVVESSTTVTLNFVTLSSLRAISGNLQRWSTTRLNSCTLSNSLKSLDM